MAWHLFHLVSPEQNQRSSSEDSAAELEKADLSTFSMDRATIQRTDMTFIEHMVDGAEGRGRKDLKSHRLNQSPRSLHRCQGCHS